MTAVTENDLKRLEDLIINGQKFLDTRLSGIETRLSGIESKIGSLVEDVNALRVEVGMAKVDIKGMEKRLDDFNKHFYTMTIGFLSIIGVLVTGVLGAIGKLVFFPNL